MAGQVAVLDRIFYCARTDKIRGMGPTPAQPNTLLGMDAGVAWESEVVSWWRFVGVGGWSGDDLAGGSLYYRSHRLAALVDFRSLSI
jgi:hypothetical protein